MLLIREAEGLLDRYHAHIATDSQAAQFISGWGASSSRTRGLHASELRSNGCLRPAVYSLKGAPRDEHEEFDAFWKKKFRAGHALHSVFQYDFHQMAKRSGGLLDFDDEVRVGPEYQAIAKEYDFSSSTDGRFGFRRDPYGPLYLRVGLEIKAISPNSWPEDSSPPEYYLDQVCAYMRMLDLPLMWILYYCKGTHAIKPSKYPWLIEFDFDRWERLDDVIHRVNTHVHTGTMPERQESFSCEFCGFKGTCQPKILEKKKQRKAARDRRDALHQREQRARKALNQKRDK